MQIWAQKSRTIDFLPSANKLHIWHLKRAQKRIFDFSC